jgi:hypothetical protein
MLSRVYRYCAVSVLAAIFAVTAANGAFAEPKKDYILVLDTSYSMAGSGGKNIIEGVKSSLNAYIDKMGKGDSLTFATFSDDVTFYPTVKLEDQNDKDIVKKYLTMVQAKGSWTYTLEMVKKVLAKADELQKADKGRQVVILVMTDTLDDPPPSKRNLKMSIKDVAKNYQGNDWFVYLISINDLQNNDRIKGLAKDLSASLPSTAVVPGTDPNKALADADKLKNDALAKKARDRVINTVIAIVVAILALVLLGALWRFLYAKFFSYSLTGYLDYRYTDSPYKDYDRFDMSNVGEKKMEIGRGAQFRLNLRDFGDRTPVVIQARRFEGVIHPVVLEAVSAPVEFLNGKNTTFLVDGDSFKAGGYIFIYHEK